MSVIINNNKLKAAALARHRGEKLDWGRIKNLLLQGWSKSEIAKEVGCSTGPIQKMRKLLIKDGFEDLLQRNSKGVSNATNSKTDTTE